MESLQKPQPVRAVLRLALPTLAAAGFVTAAWWVAPHAIDAAVLLSAQDDPAKLADHAVAKALSPAVVRSEVEDALATGDPELAASFLELAHERGIAVDRTLAARVDAANATSVQAMRAASSFAHGLITGTPDDMAGLAGAATGDLFVFGDIRDAARESIHLMRGEPADELILGLACAGMAITAGTYLSVGAGAPARVGLSLVKAARRAGKLSAPVTEWLTRSAREAVDTRALGAILQKASLTAPSEALRAARDAVKVERVGRIAMLADDLARVRAGAGTRAAIEGLKLAEEPQDVARLARLAEAKGGKTRAILKLAGRAAFVLTAAAFDLASWLFAAICAVFGFCSAVKRTAERATEAWLRRKKARRAASSYAPAPG
jgi:hypothetical protein